MQVPLLDLKEQLAPLRDEILAAVTRVIDSTQYIMGPEVEKLESELAAYCGTRHAIGISSGTDALLAVLMTMEVGTGDLVLTTPYTFFATMGAILRVGARPLFADIDPVSYNIDPDCMEWLLKQEPARTKRVKAIMPVHLFGQCASMDRIMEIAGRYNIPVIEDAAQAIGAAMPLGQGSERRWVKAGAMGLAGCFSFFPSKNLGCLGDGGIVTCNDDAFAEKLRVIRVHGSKPKYHHYYVGGNFRLDPLQAAVLSVKLPHLPVWHRARRANAAFYDRLFNDSDLVRAGHVQLPQAIYQAEAQHAADEPDYHIYNQYVIRVERRDELREHLTQKSVGVEVYYPIPLHRQKCVAPLGLPSLTFPNAERAAQETLALPIFPELTRDKQSYVVERIAEFYFHKR